jgi:hypothetical protein
MVSYQAPGDASAYVNMQLEAMLHGRNTDRRKR